MLITPKYVNPPKPGKKSWSIKTADNTLYFFDPQGVGMTPTFGQPLECEVKVDGKWNVITSMKAAGGGGGSASVASSLGGAAPWWAPFVSNVCAHAIAAGKVEGPADLLAWAVAAKSAAMELTMVADEEPA